MAVNIIVYMNLYTPISILVTPNDHIAEDNRDGFFVRKNMGIHGILNAEKNSYQTFWIFHVEYRKAWISRYKK